MSYQLRPPVRADIPLIIGVAGPTKSGKTYSSHRLARGMVGPGGKVAMLNAEGRRGHQYYQAPFDYVAAEMEAPYSVEKYIAAVKEIATQKPGVLIIDSCSHMHDGPGGMLDEHEAIVQRMAHGDAAKRDRVSFAAWVKPKQDENVLIYTLLALPFPVILSLRAKEKIKLVGGKPVDMGWQPIVSERVAFETLVTLMLPPHSKGVPDLDISDLRAPFDALIPKGRQIDEDLGRSFAEWARGGVATSNGAPAPALPPAPARQPAQQSLTPPDERTRLIDEMNDLTKSMAMKDRLDLFEKHLGARTGSALKDATVAQLTSLIADVKSRPANMLEVIAGKGQGQG